jgi:hypothetical protein
MEGKVHQERASVVSILTFSNAKAATSLPSPLATENYIPEDCAANSAIHISDKTLPSSIKTLDLRSINFADSNPAFSDGRALQLPGREAKPTVRWTWH